MPSSENPSDNIFPALPVPSVAEVDRIASEAQPILRNLHITQCYYELSMAFARRTGPFANWCTYATWASKQAGQTIRREDLIRSLEALLKGKAEIEQALTAIATIAKGIGARKDLEQMRKGALLSLITTSVDRASEAVSRGNKKVFEEIARQFARFITTCFDDAVYGNKRIEDFCRQLRSGNPPDGQRYLCQAFTRYYQSFYEADQKKKSELQLLANLEVGFHEQTRLQPEIVASLNAAAFVDLQQVKSRLLALFFPGTDYRAQLRIFLLRFFQQTRLLDHAIQTLVLHAQHHIRMLLTAHLMTLTLPPDNRLRLGQDLNAAFPTHLKELLLPELQSLLVQIDPTPDSLHETGAADWADLKERLHFIADLFRCYHEDRALFMPPFTPEQIAALKADTIPEGHL